VLHFKVIYIYIYSIGHFSVSYGGQLRNETDPKHLPVPTVAVVMQMLDSLPSTISVYLFILKH